MAISQNCCFSGEALPDTKGAHPPGSGIAAYLEAELLKRDVTVSGFDNWRDSGWSLTCGRGQSRLEVLLAATTDGRWMLQVAPASVPGLFGRLFGAKPSATPEDVLALARTVHQILAAHGNFDDFKWCWDGFPDSDTGTAEPMADARQEPER